MGSTSWRSRCRSASARSRPESAASFWSSSSLKASSLPRSAFVSTETSGRAGACVGGLAWPKAAAGPRRPAARTSRTRTLRIGLPRFVRSPPPAILAALGCGAPSGTAPLHNEKGGQAALLPTGIRAGLLFLGLMQGIVRRAGWRRRARRHVAAQRIGGISRWRPGWRGGGARRRPRDRRARGILAGAVGRGRAGPEQHREEVETDQREGADQHNEDGTAARPLSGLRIGFDNPGHNSLVPVLGRRAAC